MSSLLLINKSYFSPLQQASFHQAYPAKAWIKKDENGLIAIEKRQSVQSSLSVWGRVQHFLGFGPYGYRTLSEKIREIANQEFQTATTNLQILFQNPKDLSSNSFTFEQLSVISTTLKNVKQIREHLINADQSLLVRFYKIGTLRQRVACIAYCFFANLLLLPQVLIEKLCSKTKENAWLEWAKEDHTNTLNALYDKQINLLLNDSSAVLLAEKNIRLAENESSVAINIYLDIKNKSIELFRKNDQSFVAKFYLDAPVKSISRTRQGGRSLHKTGLSYSVIKSQKDTPELKSFLLQLINQTVAATGQPINELLTPTIFREGSIGAIKPEPQPLTEAKHQELSRWITQAHKDRCLSNIPNIEQITSAVRNSIQ